MRQVGFVALLLGASLMLVGCGPTVPDTRGMTVEQATQTIESAGFGAGKVTYDEKATGAAGAVIAQEPRDGKHAKNGSLVVLTVVGPPPVPTPDLPVFSASDVREIHGGTSIPADIFEAAMDAGGSWAVNVSEAWIWDDYAIALVRLPDGNGEMGRVTLIVGLRRTSGSWRMTDTISFAEWRSGRSVGSLGGLPSAFTKYFDAQLLDE